MYDAKVTIIMPVYNGGQHFRLALESALAQTYENIEIVIINDGSTDGGETEAIASKCAARIIYVHQANKGVAGALNTGISHMTGEYFTWLSHDNIHLPSKVQRQLEFASRLGKADAMLISDYELIDPKGESISTVRLPHRQLVENPMLPLMQGWINGCTVFIPANIMREFGPFDESLRYTQDYDLWNKILPHHEFFHQPEVLVQHRVHPGLDSHKPAAAAEGDGLWIRMMDSRTEIERVHLFGSTRRYFSKMAGLLEQTPYERAAAYARAQVPRAISGTLVSIIMPVWNEMALACRAVRTALAQTHDRLEVIAIDDGSTESIAELEDLARQDARLRVVRQPNAGPGAARNRGMNEASGEYLAFLDADDQFLPHKVARQLQLMQQGGHLISHTSYYVAYQELGELLGLINSGHFSGNLYPAVISSCPIAMPTAMIHRSLLLSGFRFPIDSRIGEDVLAWIEVAIRHEILGIPEPLSIVEWSSTTAALNCEKQIIGLFHILASVNQDPMHRRQALEVAQLSTSLRRVALLWMQGARFLPERLTASGLDV